MSFSASSTNVNLLLNTLASGRNHELSHQDNWIARGFAQKFLQYAKCYRPSQRPKSGKSSSLHSKKNFAWGVQVFCEFWGFGFKSCDV